jgi:hypothetical protein
VTRINPDLNRSTVIALCLELGHDPDRISSITLYPDRVSVTYEHFISGVAEPFDTGTVANPKPL